MELTRPSSDGRLSRNTLKDVSLHAIARRTRMAAEAAAAAEPAAEEREVS
jgi:hypothetical protein